MKKSTVHIDGLLYFATAAAVPALEYLSSEEAYKYVAPLMLFWLKFTIGSAVSGANGLKAFRSMTFARFAQEQQTTEIKPTPMP